MFVFLRLFLLSDQKEYEIVNMDHWENGHWHWHWNLIWRRDKSQSEQEMVEQLLVISG